MIPNSKLKIRLCPKPLFPVISALLLLSHPEKSMGMMPQSDEGYVSSGLRGFGIPNADAVPLAGIIVVGRLGSHGSDYGGGQNHSYLSRIIIGRVLKGAIDNQKELTAHITVRSKGNHQEIEPQEGNQYIFFIHFDTLINGRELGVLKMIPADDKSIEEIDALIKKGTKTPPPAH